MKNIIITDNTRRCSCRRLCASTRERMCAPVLRPSLQWMDDGGMQTKTKWKKGIDDGSGSIRTTSDCDAAAAAVSACDFHREPSAFLHAFQVMCGDDGMFWNCVIPPECALIPAQHTSLPVGVCVLCQKTQELLCYLYITRRHGSNGETVHFHGFSPR